MHEGLRHVLDYWRAGGPLVLPIALTCFGIWYLVYRMRARLLAGTATLNRAIAGIPDLMDGSPPAHASGIEQAIGRILADIARGVPLNAAFAEHVEPAAGEARRDLTVLRALIAIAPLLGLLGTVFGMMATFGAVGGREVTESVAAGISTALITTQFGLFVAIPGMFGAARIARLLRHYEARLTVCRTRLIIELDRRTERRAA